MTSNIPTTLILLLLFSIATSTQVTVTWNVGSHLSNVINPGTTLGWKTTDGDTHTVTFDNPTNEVQDIGDFSSTTKSITFQTYGSYHYYCQIHGVGLMDGTVLVTNGTATTTDGSTSDSTSISSTFALTLGMLTTSLIFFFWIFSMYTRKQALIYK